MLPTFLTLYTAAAIRLWVLGGLGTSSAQVVAQATSFDPDNIQYNDCYTSENNYSFCLNVPPSYEEQSTWPLLVYLTGSGAKGGPGEAKYLTTYDGVGNVLAETLGGNPTDAGVAIRDRFVTALVITPTTDYVVDPDAVISIVFSNLAMLNRITARRVYLAGYSLGCRGTLRALVSYPNLFAAAVCSAGYAEQEGDNNLLQDGDAMPTYPLLDRAIGVPIAFGYSPVDETNAPEKTIATIDRLSDAGAVCNTVETFPNYTHSQMSLAQYSQVSTYEWLLRQFSSVTTPPVNVSRPTLNARE